jgi:ABC-2 type transport system permease protein
VVLSPPVDRYWRIYKSFFTSSFRRELEFRANFFAKVFQNVMWIFFFIMILLVIYGNTDSVAGWSRGEAFILAATIFLMSAMSSALFFSLQDIPNQVRMGTLDFVVTKPVDSQFWVSVRRFSFDQIGTLVAGIVMVILGTVQAGVAPSLAQWGVYSLLVLTSLVLFYAFNLALMTTAIWLIRVENLWVLGESVTQVARFPLDIYGLGLQRFLTFAFPLAFLATVPARTLVLGIDWWMVLLGLLWAFLAFWLSRRFWRYAMRHYTSASS